MCDPRAGASPKTTVCAHACDSVYRACADEHFAEDALGRAVPCRATDTICAKLSDWMAHGTGVGENDERGERKPAGARMCEAAGYDVVSAGRTRAEGDWCFDPADASGSAAGYADPAREKPSKSADAERRGEGRKDGKKKKKNGLDSEAEELARLRTWTHRLYAAVGLGAVARVAYKVWDRKRRESGSGAARRAARLAAENRNRSAALENQAKMF